MHHAGGGLLFMVCAPLIAVISPLLLSNMIISHSRDKYQNMMKYRDKTIAMGKRLIHRGMSAKIADVCQYPEIKNRVTCVDTDGMFSVRVFIPPILIVSLTIKI